MQDNAILWVLNFTSRDPTAINVTFDLASTVQQFATVGTWVYEAPNNPDNFEFRATTGAGGERA